MYVIIVYDVGQERVARVCKYLRRSLKWVQNSVFEGELTKAQLTRIKAGLSKLISEDMDSVIIYQSRDEKWLDREVMGQEKSPTSNIM